METLDEKLKRAAYEPSKEEIFAEYLQKMQNLYQAKNSDYGDSFSKSCNEYGLLAPIIRISDKLERVKTLSKNNSSKKVEDEKIEDTLLDLANYAVMTLVWLKKK